MNVMINRPLEVTELYIYTYTESLNQRPASIEEYT